MSGIVGILRTDAAPLDRALLRSLTQFLAFRGPDHLATWSAGAVGLGHALLLTTGACETSGSEQPCTLDGRTWITADARLDGRKEFVDKLEAHGRVGVKAASDAELILHAYEVWGDSCPAQLLGDFTFAIWDDRQRSLICARDPLGAKPFFYALVDHSLIFSNTLECLRAHPEVSDRLNELAVADFLLFGENQNLATTTFADIQRLPPAHTLTCSAGEFRVCRYWSLPVEDVLRYRKPDEYVEQFRELFRVAMEDRLRTNRIAVLMSGGLDSTTVAAAAKQALGGENAPFAVRAFTSDWRPLFADEELDYARLAADALGIPLEPLRTNHCVPYERWNEPRICPPEPVHEPFLALQDEHFRQVSAHSRVVLTGDGGDVILLGQTWPYLKRLLWAGQMTRFASELGGYILSHRRLPSLLGGFRTRMRRWVDLPVEEPVYPEFLHPDLERRLKLRSRWEELNSKPEPVHPIRPRAHKVLTDPSWPSTFEKEDAGVTRFPLDIRRPFFDLRLVRFTLRVPPLPWCADKDLLREAMRGVLPEAVRRRPKVPLLGDPLWEWMRKKDWRPEKNFAPAPELCRFVDLERFEPAAPIESPEAAWFKLMALSLNYWLQTAMPPYKLRVEANGETRVRDKSKEGLPWSEADHLRQPR